MNRTILVTAIGGDVGNGILKCLLETGDRLIGCDMCKYPVGMDLVSEFFISLPAADSGYCSELLKRCQKFGVTHLIPVSEVEISAINSNRELFEEASIQLIMNSNFIINTCLDKLLTMQFLSSYGICIPHSYVPETFIENGEQHILKLRNSCGSKLLKVFSTADELNAICAQNHNSLIIQQYIDCPDEEYTVGVFAGNGEDIRTIAFRRKLSGGYTKFIELSCDESIKADAIKVAKALHLVGSINIQLRKYNGENFIFEINPRLSGTTHFRDMLGFCDVRWWLDACDGIAIQPYHCEYKRAIGVRELNEKYLQIEPV